MSLELIFLHAGRIPKCDARVDKHFEGYQSLQFVRRGTVELFYGEARHVVEAPAFWICSPGPHIRFHGYQGKAWHHQYIAMRGPGLVDLQRRGLLFSGVQSFPPRKADPCASLMDRIIRLISSPGTFSVPKAVNLLEYLLLELAEWRRADSQSKPWLAKLLSALEGSAQANPDYQSLARGCGMALSTLRRRFQKEMGISLHRHVLERRISKALKLVGATELPFKDIAEQLGYDNVFYFSRQFRKHQGVPPRIYRRSRQA
jgi:AraC-like DNA-binding protein